MVVTTDLAIEMNKLLQKLARKSQTYLAVRRSELRRMPEELPLPIVQSLTVLARRVLHIFWVEGLLWLLATLCSLLILQGLLDWFFDLSRLLRGCLVVIDLMILSLIGLRFGVRPWQQRLTPEETALCAERHWPDLQTGLISAVQLAGKPNGSQVLVNALLDDVAEGIAKLDLRLAAPWQRLMKLMVGSLLLAGVSVGLIAALAPQSWILLQRMALVKVPLPTQTVVAAGTQNLGIDVGETLELSAKAIGVIPRSGRVEITYEGRSPVMVAVSPKATSPEVFSLEIANVQQVLSYRFYLNDGKGEVWKVVLQHPPVLREIKFEAISPAYSEIPVTELKAGRLSLLAGSTLKITGKASQPLKELRIVFSGKQHALEIKAEGDDRSRFSAEVAIPAAGLDGLWLELKNDQEIVSKNNTIYAIEILPDQVPEIKIAEGQPEKLSYVAQQIPRLRFEVRDDFKVSQVIFCVQQTNVLDQGEKPDPAKALQIPIPVKLSAAGLTFDFEWQERAKHVAWKEGNTFTYWIKALDNNEVTGPGITYTAPREWSFVSLETKRQELAEQLRKQAEAIKALSEAQEILRNQTSDIIQQDYSK